MAIISINSKEVQALYFLIETQEKYLKSCENDVFKIIANESIKNAEALIKKYCDSFAREKYRYEEKKRQGRLKSKHLRGVVHHV